MSTLKQRLGKTMHSTEGAEFQAWAEERLDRKGSRAHQLMGALITLINRGLITKQHAQFEYERALEK